MFYRPARKPKQVSIDYTFDPMAQATGFAVTCSTSPLVTDILRTGSRQSKRFGEPPAVADGDGIRRCRAGSTADCRAFSRRGGGRGPGGIRAAAGPGRVGDSLTMLPVLRCPASAGARHRQGRRSSLRCGCLHLDRTCALAMPSQAPLPGDAHREEEGGGLWCVLSRRVRHGGSWWAVGRRPGC
jgi:hypothetical protein